MNHKRLKSILACLGHGGGQGKLSVASSGWLVGVGIHAGRLDGIILRVFLLDAGVQCS